MNKPKIVTANAVGCLASEVGSAAVFVDSLWSSYGCSIVFLKYWIKCVV